MEEKNAFELKDELLEKVSGGVRYAVVCEKCGNRISGVGDPTVLTNALQNKNYYNKNGCSKCGATWSFVIQEY